MGMINEPGRPLMTHEQLADIEDEEADEHARSEAVQERRTKEIIRQACFEVDALIRGEMTHHAPDARRVLRDTRTRLQTAIEAAKRDPVHYRLGPQLARARETREAWGC